jgi:predicted MFS family arabinose efflux permease
LADPAKRGRQVGAVLGGLLTGILFCRPIASLIASVSGWRSVFMVAAFAVAVTAVVLRLNLPKRYPEGRKSYVSVLASLLPLLLRTRALRRRMAYHMGLFFAFSVFWTTIPLELNQHYGLHQRGIAIFSLFGAAGAFSAPVAGRMVDAGRTFIGTIGSMVMVALGIALTWPASALHGWAGLAGLAVATVLLDAGVQAHQPFAQKVLFDLPAEQRSRVNAIFVAGVFLAAAVGSAVAPLVYTIGQWPLVAVLGTVPPLLALGSFLLHQRGPSSLKRA